MTGNAERASSPPRSSRPPLDRDGLLAALILAPGTYSRNKNFDLYRAEDLLGVQRRARTVRGLLRLMLRDEEKTIDVDARDDEFIVTVRVPALRLTRTTRLSPLEFELVEFLRARANGASPRSPARVDAALRRLSGLG